MPALPKAKRPVITPEPGTERVEDRDLTPSDAMVALAAAGSPYELTQDAALDHARNYNEAVVRLRGRFMELAERAVERCLASLELESDPVRLVHVAARATEITRGLAADAALRLEVTRAVTSDARAPAREHMIATLRGFIGAESLRPGQD